MQRTPDRWPGASCSSSTVGLATGATNTHHGARRTHRRRPTHALHVSRRHHEGDGSPTPDCLCLQRMVPVRSASGTPNSHNHRRHPPPAGGLGGRLTPAGPRVWAGTRYIRAGFVSQNSGSFRPQNGATARRLARRRVARAPGLRTARSPVSGPPVAVSRPGQPPSRRAKRAAPTGVVPVTGIVGSGGMPVVGARPAASSWS